MKLTVFQSDKGDCLLLQSDDGKHVLVDGGMKTSYQKHVAPALGKLRQAGTQLNLVYLSHIDQDHVAGILQLMDDAIAWRVFDFQRANGNTHIQPPTNLRPPEVSAIWHNAFHEQIGQNAGSIADLLAASSKVLAASNSAVFLDLAEEHAELALSQLEAMRLVRRVGAGQLKIPVNSEFGGKLMYVRPAAAPIPLGRLTIFIIGPFEEDLKNLRKEWNAWLRTNQKRVRELQRRSAKDEGNLGNEMEQLIRTMEIRAQVFGDREKVTTPNLASLMLYVEEPQNNGGQRRLLLTGDGHWEDILKGLRHYRKFDQDPEGIHVDVLKGQHHGSEHNWHPDFCRAVTADHYIFCGNGKHENPDLGVLEMVIASRVGPEGKRSRNAETDKPFTLWFNCSAEVEGEGPAVEHMKKVEKLVRKATNENSKVRSRFLKKSSFVLQV